MIVIHRPGDVIKVRHRVQSSPSNLSGICQQYFNDNKGEQKILSQPSDSNKNNNDKKTIMKTVINIIFRQMGKTITELVVVLFFFVWCC